MAFDKKKSDKSKEKQKNRLKERVTEMLDLPKEIVLDMPKLTMLGNGDLVIENYKGIVEYEDNRIRINTASGLIKIIGSKLFIREITSENIMINGNISALEFVN